MEFAKEVHKIMSIPTFSILETVYYVKILILKLYLIFDSELPNPCETNNGDCSDTCENNNGVAECSCIEGILKADGKTCIGNSCQFAL